MDSPPDCPPAPQHNPPACLPIRPSAMECINKKAKQKPPPLPPPTPTADSSVGGGDDRISALDDDLCELILRLASLNARELVRTSVLSRRWRGLWKRCPVLDFFGWPELDSAGDVQHYITIVNDVLEQRAGATSEARIDELKIPLLFDDDDYCGYCCARRKPRQWTPSMKAAAMKAVEMWIRYAMHHQVKAFHFNLRLRAVQIQEKYVMDLDELLPCSPKLECLHLKLDSTKVRLPRTALFTSLKDLTLGFVTLATCSCHLLARLLSSVCCPRLQKLCMSYFAFYGAGTNELVLEAGELLELSMECVLRIGLLELRTPKLLCLKINECEDIESLKISAPGLKELTYFSNTDTAFIQGRLPCVQRLKIDLYTFMKEGGDDEGDPNRSNIYLLKLCSSSVRCLLVHLDVPWEEERHIDLIKDNIPQLPNVTSLLVSIDVTCGRHSFGDGVAGFLTRFKNLEYLSLVLDDSPRMDLKRDEYYIEDAAAFSCNHPDHWNASNIYLPKLRGADFRGLTGTGCEIRFLQFVLASAIDLQSVTVSFNLSFIEEVQDSRMHYFLHSLLGDGTWTTRDDEIFDKPYEKCSKLYKWVPSP